MSIAAMEKALEALEDAANILTSPMFGDAAAALRAAIEAAEKQEPAAKYIGECFDGSLVQLYEDVKKGTNFYTHPLAQPSPVQEPAFHGFMDKENGCVHICYTPWAPRATDGKLPTAYYTTPLAQPAPVQEPVRYPFKHGGVKIVRRGHAAGLLNNLAKWMRREKIGDYQTLELVATYVDALETTPPAQPAQRQPLEQERIDKIIEQCQITLLNYCCREKQTEFARAVEAAHGITGEKT